ncbi:MAG: 3-phosphoserine/phosphohydroxythreonine transaminase, partial [Gammaproteobacteria bacterium]|nr:3-phosphoserine/phosphohydroxythreonine transaminase [Gammaproteobacteria bacterium]
MTSRIEKILPASKTDTRYYFGAGPAMLPREVLEQAQEELLDWHGTGISVLEMGHRTDAFRSIADQAERDIRELLAVPDNYKVLFIQGGASNQFAMVPLNLLGNRTAADYLHTGYWSGKAMQEAARFCEVHAVISNAGDQHRSIPPVAEWQLDPAAAYVYFTDNETIQGVEFTTCPDSGNVPLVTDMTSNLLSRTVPVHRYGIIFAGTQKNMG